MAGRRSIPDSPTEFHFLVEYRVDALGLRRFGITPIKRHPAQDSLRGKLLSCGYSTDFLAEVLGFTGD